MMTEFTIAAGGQNILLPQTADLVWGTIAFVIVAVVVAERSHHRLRIRVTITAGN